MNYVLLKILVLLFSMLTVNAEQMSVDEILSNLRTDEKLNEDLMVDGFAVGASGSPGIIYSLAKRIIKERKDLIPDLMNDQDPEFIALGLVCKANLKEEIPILIGNEETIEVLPFGCRVQTMTLEEFSVRLKKDEAFNYSFTKKEKPNPNKAGIEMPSGSASRHSIP